ncbi:MAG: hypothetical protein N4A63_13520 [Vallitalea sp.]|jgi:succinate dehydrogenase/fumarate reductase cytochrome b subunit|nr:hypothetical protein [Vallitalea sp.]
MITIILAIVIGIIAFFGMLGGIRLLYLIAGYGSGLIVLSACLLGAVLISCTYLIITKINKLSNTIDSNEDEEDLL